MAIILEEIYEVALHRYNMKLVAVGRGLINLVDWVHTVEEMDYVSFLKGRELIITTGIREKDEETLVRFVKSLHETGASGLVINIGKYITRVPRGVIAYSEEAGFPVFTLPWEVHLVDFNRDLCNLIYKTMQEQDGLETALQKAIFSHKEEQQYMPVLHENHIHKDTEFFMIQCYFPANGWMDSESGNNEQAQKGIEDKRNAKRQGEKKSKFAGCIDDKFDNTQFFYRFIRQCQQLFAQNKVLSVIFQRDLYITLIAKVPVGTERENVITQIEELSKEFSQRRKLYLAIGAEDTTVSNLWEKYRDLSYLCRWGREKDKKICREEELGISKLWLSINNVKKLEKYREEMLGELEHLDKETGSEYLRILKCYLETNGNIGEVATECYLHRNTVSYHLKKIAEITGKTLNSTKDRSDWYLAYQIDEFLKLI